MPLDYGFGGEAWGADEWGSGDSGGMTVQSVIPIRENAIRVGFSNPVYFSLLNDDGDASRADYYSISAESDTIGADGLQARDVGVTEIVLSDFDGAGGFFVDVITDRPMSPYPALYVLSVSGLRDRAGIIVTPSSNATQGLFRALVPPSLDKVIPSRDFANRSGFTPKGSALPDAFVADETGDYAYDEGDANLKKRIFRRGLTSPGAFAHLPGYGVGLADHGKRLATVAVRSRLAAEYERQILLEPDVLAASVNAVTDQNFPSITRFVVLARTRGNKQLKFTIPIDSNE